MKPTDASGRFKALSPEDQLADLRKRIATGITEAQVLLNEAWQEGDRKTVEVCQTTLATLRQQQAGLPPEKS